MSISYPSSSITESFVLVGAAYRGASNPRYSAAACLVSAPRHIFYCMLSCNLQAVAL